MRIKQSLPLALTLGLLLMVGLASISLPFGLASTLAPHITSAACQGQGASQAAAQTPISFEMNAGQANSQVRFLARGPGYGLSLTPTEALLSLNASGPASSTTSGRFLPASASPALGVSAGSAARVGMQFLHANPQPEVTGEQRLPGIVNYIVGNDPNAWYTNIPTYARVRYHNLYPGIDLVYYSNQGHLEYDFVVAPGSDPSQIHLNFTGATSLSIDAQRNLLLHLPAGNLPEGAPSVYQDINGARQAVASQYRLQSATEVGFALGAYDASKPLVIDPMVLFSTYLGGQGNDMSSGIATDSLCNVYITGSTSSTNLPTLNPAQANFGGGFSDAFVTKLNAEGTGLIYSTYLGGSGTDAATSIAIDNAGNAYITGSTFSTDFPTHTAVQATLGGLDDAFVAELNAAGSALVYSTYLGGTDGADWGNAIAVDAAGAAYVTGGTSSTTFPTHAPLQPAKKGIANAFVAKLSAGGTALTYSTYLGGGNYDYGAGIALDGSGNAYVTGSTHSSNFPTHTPVQASWGGLFDAFVAKVNAAGSALVYATYLGGSGNDSGYSVVVDSANNAYITGSTSSTNFPTYTPAQSSNGGAADAFITKLNAAGTALAYSTYLGGANDEEATSIALDSANNAYITGRTSSTNFPTHNALQTANAGSADAFVARLNAAGTIFLISSYFGGSGNDSGQGILVDSPGNVYITGSTASPDFPTSTPMQTYGGQEDGFLMKLGLMAPEQFQVSPGYVYLTTTPGSSPGPQTISLSNAGDMTMNWSASGLPSWVSVSPASGSLAAGDTQPLTLTFNTPTANTYTTNLVLTDPGASNSPVSIPITVVSANVAKTWYFAEGFTGTGFTEYLTLANPNNAPNTVTVQYLLQGKSPITKQYSLAKNSRATLNINSEIGAGQNVSMVVTGTLPLIAERPMYFLFGGKIPGGSDVLGATSLSQDFDFGYLDTTANHSTYLTILNQQSSTMDVTISYFPAAGGDPTVIHHTVGANSRGTVNVNTEGLPQGTYSALVHLSLPGLVERPLYLKDTSTGFTGAGDVVGVAQPLTDWDFAEGFVSPTFTERYILSNPGSDTATGTVTFFLDSGSPVIANFTLAPGQQQTILVNSLLSGNNSAHVQADQPILAERFMSFKFGTSIPGATDVLGAGQPSNLFEFAEGFTGTGFSEYLTIANPNASQAATVQVTFLPSDGSAPLVRVYTIAPSTRFTLNTATVITSAFKNRSFSMVVESNVSIVAERPMYFNFPGGRTGGSDVVGYQP